MTKMVMSVAIVVFLWMFLFIQIFSIRKKVKELKQFQISDIQFRDLLLIFLGFFTAGSPFTTMFLFADVRIRSFFIKILETIINTVMGAGLFYGFLTTLTVGLGYVFVVASFVFKDKQRRVAAMSGFVTGQFIMFTSIYCPGLHQALVQPYLLLLLFLGSFVVQLVWTSRETLDKAELVDPEDLIILQRRRILRLQLEFMMSFFAQICNPYLEPNSLLTRLINLSSSNYTKAQNIFFIGSAFVGCVIGDVFLIILFIQFFEFIAIFILWLRRNFFEK